MEIPASIASARNSPIVAKLAKYSIGSAVALTTSTVVFALLLAVHSNNTTIDSVAAFVAGAIPNWILNRRWAWERTGDVEVVREIIGYASVSLVALAASSWGTSLMQTWVRHHVTGGSGLRTVLVTSAYVAVQVLLFAVKFVIYDRWVFTGQSRFRKGLAARRAAFLSRRQVVATARANRIP